jgi:hypothetical protein
MSEHPVRATLAGILLFVIGLAIGIGAIENFRRERDRLQGWTRAEGEVVQVLQVSGRSRAVVGFTAAGGDRIRFTDPGGAGRRDYRVGERVPVLYPVVDPSAARLDSPAIRWARSIYAGTGALVLMALGIYIAWYARRRDAERAVQ